MKMIRKILLIATLLASCNLSSEKALILWSSDMEETGKLATILEESILNDNYTIRIGDDTKTMEKWRIQKYDTHTQTRDAAEQFAPFRYIFAYSERRALPIRESTDRLSPIIYRLKDAEVVKILSRSEEKIDEEDLLAYWYRVLTENGTQGFVFGYYLQEFDIRNDIPDAEQGSDESLIDLLENTWRPEEYRDMIARGQINLSRFSPHYGLFPEEGGLRIVLPEYSHTLPYEQFHMVSSNRYAATGTSLEVTFFSDSITLQYDYQNQLYQNSFILLEDDILEIIAAEHERRTKLFEEITSRSVEHQSDAYGTLILTPDQEFIWKEAPRIPVMPGGIGSRGKMTFPLFLSPTLAIQYTGAVAFLFEARSDPIFFLYSLKEDGWQLTFLPIEYVEDEMVTKVPSSPFIIYFRFR